MTRANMRAIFLDETVTVSGGMYESDFGDGSVGGGNWLSLEVGQTKMGDDYSYTGETRTRCTETVVYRDSKGFETTTENAGCTLTNRPPYLTCSGSLPTTKTATKVTVDRTITCVTNFR